jgi:hypothetical protein
VARNEATQYRKRALYEGNKRSRKHRTFPNHSHPARFRKYPKSQHADNLNEIQRRAYRIHERHGGVYGGYTLEDWLEAEHELDEEDNSPTPKKDQIH